jgi:hypothetical protein
MKMVALYEKRRLKRRRELGWSPLGFDLAPQLFERGEWAKHHGGVRVCLGRRGRRDQANLARHRGM